MHFLLISIIILDSSKEKYNSFCVNCIPLCKDCDIRYFCGGACRALAYDNCGDLYGSDSNCEVYKERVLQVMKVVV